jgi:hypothetical protein
MKLKRFGFFGDFPKDKGREMLFALRSENARPDEQGILKYLRGGRRLLAASGIVEDTLDPRKGMIGPPDVFSDGEWLWTSDVIYYLENYHIEVPAEFIERMKQHGWECPVVDNPQQLVMTEWHT